MKATAPSLTTKVMFPSMQSSASSLSRPRWAYTVSRAAQRHHGLGQIVLVLLALAAFTLPATVRAQAFQNIPALSFTKTLDSASNPLPQTIVVNSTGASISIGGVTATTNSGGNWLSVTYPQVCCSSATPNNINVIVTPSVSLTAGTYTGQIAITQNGGAATLTVPVSLTIQPSSATFFDELPGAYTFAMEQGTPALAPQALPIRNAGEGSLSWTSSISTADGGSWLSLSLASGTAPSMPNVLVNPANLPNGGRIAGTYTGQILLKSAGGNVTIPVEVVVGPSVLSQIPPLSFNKTVFSTSNPLTQVVTVADTGASTGLSVVEIDGTGGSWLSVQLGGSCCGYATPTPLTVTVAPNVNLAAGTYTAEIIITGGTEIEIVPVTLAIEPASASFFDVVPGELTFSMQTAGSAPPFQSLPIRNAGTGTLAWTASTTTADGGNWLILSASSGTAPSTPSVGIIPANLPSAGMVPGTFTGQVVLFTNGSTVTVPITVTVGDDVFRQNNPLSFTKMLDSGSNPLPQVMTVASTGASIPLSATAVAGTGGSWLSIQYSGSCCGYTTPNSFTVTANPDISLPAGTYTAEIVVQSNSGDRQAEVVPVTLTIEPTTSAYFDELGGQLTFSMLSGGSAPPAQVVPIRNAGAGTLSFTAAASTADGGDWLQISAASASAPYLLSVSINPANLPQSGNVAGTFTGEVVLTTAGNTVSIPVTVTVGAAVFRQVNPLSFNQTLNSTNNPLPQFIPVASTGAAIPMVATAVNGTGGNWLSISYAGNCCGYSTTEALTVSVNPSVTLAAGSYTAEVIIESGSGAEPEVVPVTLNVEPPNATYFDAVPGSLTFSSQATGTVPTAQPLPIRNAGPGTLNWTAIATTADGGNWLTISASSGVAPATPTVSINPANLPNQGGVPGTFTGQILLQTAGNMVTVPVIMTIGDSVINQPGPVSFSMSYQGAIPSTQMLTLTSTDAMISLNNATAYNATGGSWFTLQSGENCCGYHTPETFTLTASPAASLAPGVYTAGIYVTSSASGAHEPSFIPVSLTVTTGATATPTFNAPAGSYSAAQSVTINDATIDAAIYYTTDGTTPTTASARYSVPLQVTTAETIQAIAVAPGYSQSAVGSATYAISNGLMVTPGSYGFANVVVGLNTMSSMLTLQNSSTMALSGIAFSITGTNASSFSLPSSAMQCGTTLAVGASCTFAVTFAPTVAGTLSAAIRIVDSSPGSPVLVGVSGTGDPNTLTSVAFDGIGSSSLFLALGQTASAATTASPAGLGATCLWTTKTAGVVVATDNSVNGGGKTETGSAWVAWTPVSGSCTTLNATTVVYAYLGTDSVVGNRCLFNGCTVKYGGSGSASAGLISGSSEVALSAGIVTALNGAAGTGLGVTAAGTDIRPEDAEFATARALTPCGAAVASGSQYLGLGYTNGSPVKSYYSSSTFNVINFELPASYTVTPIGATPLVVLVNGPGGTNGFSDPGITNLTSGGLASFLDGTFAQTQDGLTSASTGTTQPITVLIPEPLSGAYNLMEYGVVNTQSLRSSQDVGVTQQTAEMNCSGTAVKSNPLTLPSGAGFRRRTLGTAEELYEVSFRINALGYAFWSAENFKGLTAAAAPNTKYLTIDGVDPLQTTYTGGTVPTTPAQLAGVTLANVANGSYPIWSSLRLVNLGATPSTAVTNLSTAAQRFANGSAQPNFVPYGNLYAVHSHFIPPAGSGYPSNASNGSARACSATELGGDVGGVVLTKAGDYDYCYDFGLTTGRTGLRR